VGILELPPPLGIFQVPQRRLIDLDDFGATFESCNRMGGLAVKLLLGGPLIILLAKNTFAPNAIFRVVSRRCPLLLAPPSASAQREPTRQWPGPSEPSKATPLPPPAGTAAGERTTSSSSAVANASVAPPLPAPPPPTPEGSWFDGGGPVGGILCSGGGGRRLTAKGINMV